jgi:hypothetical protein
VKIDRIDFDGKAVVILGAGATRGAEFIDPQSGGQAADERNSKTHPTATRKCPCVLPPLDGDFFTQAQRLSFHKPSELVTGLIKDVVGQFGTNFELTMEGYLTRLEQLANVFEDYRFPGRPKPNVYRQMRQRFLQVLAAVLDESIGRNPQCSYHKALVGCLSPDDAVMSFNYDWVIDYALKTHGQGKWDPRQGYGVHVYASGAKARGTQYWSCEENLAAGYTPSLKLLKMHGSMNWFEIPSEKREKEDARLRLRKRWWHQYGNLKFEIAAPEWNKPTGDGIYRRIWREARKALKEARALVVIGYSLPYTDLPAHALLMVDSDDAAPLEILAVVNPDQSSRKRIRQALLGRIGKQTRVLSFGHFREFAHFIGGQ